MISDLGVHVLSSRLMALEHHWWKCIVLEIEIDLDRKLARLVSFLLTLILHVYQSVNHDNVRHPSRLLLHFGSHFCKHYSPRSDSSFCSLHATNTFFSRRGDEAHMMLQRWHVQYFTQKRVCSDLSSINFQCGLSLFDSYCVYTFNFVSSMYSHCPHWAIHLSVYHQLTLIVFIHSTLNHQCTLIEACIGVLGIQDICHFTSRDIGCFPCYFQGYRILVPPIQVSSLGYTFKFVSYIDSHCVYKNRLVS